MYKNNFVGEFLPHYFQTIISELTLHFNWKQYLTSMHSSIFLFMVLKCLVKMNSGAKTNKFFNISMFYVPYYYVARKVINRCKIRQPTFQVR